MTEGARCDALQCLSRIQLGRLQIHARYLRDLVDRNARTLPLRRIRSIRVGAETVCIRLTEDVTTFTLSASAQNLEELFRRVNNAFVGLLTLDFRAETRPFLYYIRANQSQLQWRIRMLDVLQVAGSIDYAMVDFLGRCTRPRAFSLQMDIEDRTDHVLLFTHAALRDSVSQLEYHFYDAPAPAYIIAELLGDGAVDTCAFSVRVDPRPWIAKFVRDFETIARGMNTVRYVTLLFIREYKYTPLSSTLTMTMRESLGADVPVPDCAFVKGWCRKATHKRGLHHWTEEDSTAKRFAFENSAAKKKLEVFTWTIKEDFRCYHYVYQLQIVDL